MFLNWKHLFKRREDRTLPEKKGLSEAAEALLSDKAFQSSLLEMRQRWFGELLNEKGATLRQAELCSMLRALELLPHELGTLMNDYRMALPQAKGQTSGQTSDYNARGSRPGAASVRQ